MKYWDASAIVPLFIEEPRSTALRKILESDPERVTWWGSPVECFSALERRRRIVSWDMVEVQQVRRRLDLVTSEVDFVAPSRFLRDRAIRLVGQHSLRAGDALQLSSALVWCEEQPLGREFVTLDDRLRMAAVTEGFTVLP